MMTKEEQKARDAKLAQDEIETQQTLGKIEGLEAYETTTADQRAIIAFGMTPVELFPEESFYGAKVEHPAYRKGFTLGLMQAAKTIGKMVV